MTWLQRNPSTAPPSDPPVTPRDNKGTKSKSTKSKKREHKNNTNNNIEMPNDEVISSPSTATYITLSAPYEAVAAPSSPEFISPPTPTPTPTSASSLLSPRVMICHSCRMYMLYGNYESPTSFLYAPTIRVVYQNESIDKTSVDAPRRPVFRLLLCGQNDAGKTSISHRFTQSAFTGIHSCFPTACVGCMHCENNIDAAIEYHANIPVEFHSRWVYHNDTLITINLWDQVGGDLASLTVTSPI
jgi:hypothetical protein